MVCEVTTVKPIENKLYYNNGPTTTLSVLIILWIACTMYYVYFIFKNTQNLMLCAVFNINFNTGWNFELELRDLLDCFGLNFTLQSEITRTGLVSVGSCIDNIVTFLHQTRFHSKLVYTGFTWPQWYDPQKGSVALG